MEGFLNRKILVAFSILAAALLCLFALRRRKKELLLLLLSTAVSMFFGEIFLRFFYPQINESDKMFLFDPELGWKFIPGKRGGIVYEGEVRHFIEINPQGFRDRPSVHSKTDMKKIMVLGDSFVSNISVGADDVFTKRMEAQSENIEVLNFGVNGYNQVQEFLLLKEWAPRIKPALIIAVIYIRNDFIENTGNDWFYPRPYASLDGSEEKLTLHPPPKSQRDTGVPGSWKLYRKSHLYTLLLNGVTRLSAKRQSADRKSVPSPYDIPESYLCHVNTSSEMERMSKVMEQLILKISTCAQEQGVPVVFVLAPSLVQTDDKLWSEFLDSLGEDKSNYVRSLPNDRLMQFAKMHDLSMLDLLPTLQLENRTGKKMYNMLEQHWTKDGNRAVANALVKYLRYHSLLN